MTVTELRKLLHQSSSGESKLSEFQFQSAYSHEKYTTISAMKPFHPLLSLDYEEQ